MVNHPPLLSLCPSPRLVCMHACMYPLCRSFLGNWAGLGWVGQTKKKEKQQTDQKTNKENKHPSPCLLGVCVCVCVSWQLFSSLFPFHIFNHLLQVFSLLLGTTTQMVGSSGCQVLFFVVNDPRKRACCASCAHVANVVVVHVAIKERKNHTTGHDPCFLASHKHCIS